MGSVSSPVIVTSSRAASVSSVIPTLPSSEFSIGTAARSTAPSATAAIVSGSVGKAEPALRPAVAAPPPRR